LTDAEVERLRGIIDDSGAHAQVEAVIERLAARALAALERAEVDETARGVLRDLASAVTQRAV
jgi:geranylgeranyl diphosphate synthase type I